MYNYDREGSDVQADQSLSCLNMEQGPFTVHHVGYTMWKRVFGLTWTKKALIRLHIHAVWSGPSLSTNRIIGYYRMYKWKKKAWAQVVQSIVSSQNINCSSKYNI